MQQNKTPSSEPGEVAGNRIGAQVDGAEQLELHQAPARLLAFGSQLLHGSVGLNAAQPVYEEAGLRTVQVPSIILSVMPHYPSVHHLDVSDEWLTRALQDLEAIDALSGVELITSGYLARADQATAIATWYQDLDPASRPPLILDPTLGDVELGFYTDPGLAQKFRDELAPLAMGLTPNLFELSHLTDVPLAQLTTTKQIEEAARTLLGPHTTWVVVTGIDLPAGEDFSADIGEILVVREGYSVHRHERVETVAKGLGDTFTAALNVALLDGSDLDSAVDAAAAEVLRRTR